MSKLLEKMKMDLVLRGYSKNTQKTYLDNVKHFSNHYGKSPELLSEEDIRDYLFHSISVRKLSCSFVNTAYSSIKFFFETTLNRDRNMKNIPRVKKAKKLPVVLSKDEVKSILALTSNLKHKAILTTTYSAGLRVSEVCNLKISDIDSGNMQIHIHDAKGNKDRYSLLGKANLLVLREYFKVYRPSDWLFPNELTLAPLSVRTIQKVFQDAKDKAGIIKDVSIHSLRHSFATHLLKSGVDLVYIQKLLGHTNIQTTSIYLHLTSKDILNIISPLDTLGE
ncbi:tyrosine-type recombinase/integrase [Alkaliphilus peptidifermentans]|uniref:Site-specific recombinase XerD n=1 Tax=Alkaliphilus peptidifermentans DSM 18978 TaxID=1120976 RepID=A0A1G5GS10_9FIRM|nr:site-specific integrase [Alkaliphilus peptidifermentans]SCY54362.1 Site-specific recombinase XerD [Alkaliphilus peptidifermentans DSM 18978]